MQNKGLLDIIHDAERIKSVVLQILTAAAAILIGFLVARYAVAVFCLPCPG